MDLTEAARPIHWAGKSDRAVLLIHGFTSTPGCLTDWAEGLHRQTQATVDVPLLPGHGTSWQDLAQVSWHDWERTVLNAFDQLQKTHKTVAVGGLSLGGALAILVALQRKSVAGLALVNHLMWLRNPAISLTPILKYIIASTPAIAGDIQKPGKIEPAYDRVPTAGVDEFRKMLNWIRPQLRQIAVPTLIFKSKNDHVIPRVSATQTFERIASEQKQLIWLENSFHVAPMDNDLPLIVEKSAQFMNGLW